MGVLCPRQKLSHDPGYPVPKGRRAPTPTTPPGGPQMTPKTPFSTFSPIFLPTIGVNVCLACRGKMALLPGYPALKGRCDPDPDHAPRGPQMTQKPHFSPFSPIFPQFFPHFSPHHRGKCESGVSGEDGPSRWVPCLKRAVRSRPRPRPLGGPK